MSSRKPFIIANTRESTNASTGALIVNGGLSIRCSTDATNVSSGGALTIAGGAAIGKQLLVNGSASTGTLVVTDTSVRTSTTTLNDPRRCLTLTRGGTNDQSWPATAGVSLSRYENAGTSNQGARTRMDIELTHNINNVASTIITVLSSGNVGIGITNPNAPLQLSNSIANRKIVLYEGSNNDHQYYGFGVNASTLRYQVDATAANHVFFAASSSSASNELMRITGTGNVGIGTTNPGERLDVRGNIRIGGSNTENYIAFNGTTGDLGSHTYIGENIYGGTEQSELLLFKGNDIPATTAGPDRIRHLAAEHRFDTYETALSGTFSSVASASASNRMVILNNGNVGIGVTNPNVKLHVQGDIFASGDITAFSDARLKTDVETITGALEKVTALRGVYYNATPSNKKSVGVIAQEIQAVLPEVVNDNGEYLGVAYGNIVGVLIEAIKELNAKVSACNCKCEGNCCR
jgi:hypothetical protein